MTGLAEPTMLIGRATKVNYGIKQNGDQFKIWAADFHAEYMELIEEGS